MEVEFQVWRGASKSGPYLTGADGNYGPGHNG
jgi:hypothetical protein